MEWGLKNPYPFLLVIYFQEEDRGLRTFNWTEIQRTTVPYFHRSLLIVQTWTPEGCTSIQRQWTDSVRAKGVLVEPHTREVGPGYIKSYPVSQTDI